MRGQNPRAVEARERKKAAADAKKEAEQRAREDAKWVDDDKHTNARINRKAETEAKVEERLRRKLELKELEEEENRKVASTKQAKAQPKKLTRAEIARRQLAAQRQQEEEAKEKTTQVDLLQPNINHMLREERFNALVEGQDITVASGIDAALEQLEEAPAPDLHPERRRKVAYKEYEEEWIERLKVEHPGLKRSQMKERIFKQWQSAPENPMNQVPE
eukprot:Protomagalhaensia_sp_Gyna_25__2588@NODE_2471_length_1067_cov_11_138132_g2047_i0_p1_GENE_NODE_2471_length_1067_cov_11_138132_g2047_i0NODE_2471_length_1067_cov_11_138132_g2047_i0_p1_ORF_typecomplete_len218_score61_90Ccdc124/PF06244_12/1_8e04Ccdc124/PF06244_12/2_6e30Toxindeaminase/PF14424_6/0_68Toxindeaminase/PF14424_6/2_8e03Borrelia_P83/PF05262_11/6_8BNIP2/PF12496_8/6_8_NODE_2471_length_1067_cov_11_138132_g2047_i0107760